MLKFSGETDLLQPVGEPGDKGSMPALMTLKTTGSSLLATLLVQYSLLTD